MIGVIDGSSPKGVESAGDQVERHAMLRKIRLQAVSVARERRKTSRRDAANLWRGQRFRWAVESGGRQAQLRRKRKAVSGESADGGCAISPPAGFLFVFFAVGFYLAQFYGEISALIEQRRAALTSAIYSAPFPIRAGDDLDRSGLLDRLARLSYSQVPSASSPGEYTRVKTAIAIYLRSFQVGAKEYPAEMVRVSLDGIRIAGVADSFGVPSRRDARA